MEAPTTIAPLAAAGPQQDIDLRRMAGWAMNYLIRTPRKEFDYEPAFQCHPLRCPPVPPGHDVVVPCDTDARMNWEWYYMRAISGVQAGKDVEAGFHARLLKYVQPDGTVLAPPGAYNEGDIHKVYTNKDYVYHVWGATKILHALAEDFRKTHNPQSRAWGERSSRGSVAWPSTRARTSATSRAAWGPCGRTARSCPISGTSIPPR